MLQQIKVNINVISRRNLDTVRNIEKCCQFWTMDIHMNGSVKELNMFHNYETEKITRKASDVAENLQLYGVVRFYRDRHA